MTATGSSDKAGQDLGAANERAVITVVVPAYNDVSGLRYCLSALERQDLPRADFAVVIADNGSRPDVLEDIKALCGSSPLDLRLVVERRIGSYAARNAALGIATSKLMAFTDSDCVPHADWLSTALRVMATEPALSLLAGRVAVFVADPSHVTAAEAYDLVRAFPQKAYVSEHSFGVTANLIVRTSVFDHVGGFKSGVKSGGDFEFCRRAVNAGHGIRYEPTLVVDHPARRTLRELRLKIRRVRGGLRDGGLVGYDPPARHPLEAIKDYVPPLRAAGRARERSVLTSRRSRWKYVQAEWYVRYATLYERVRMSLGGPTSR